jgi:hypothetical protein
MTSGDGYQQPKRCTVIIAFGVAGDLTCERDLHLLCIEAMHQSANIRDDLAEIRASLCERLHVPVQIVGGTQQCHQPQHIAGCGGYVGCCTTGFPQCNTVRANGEH